MLILALITLGDINNKLNFLWPLIHFFGKIDFYDRGNASFSKIFFRVFTSGAVLLYCELVNIKLLIRSQNPEVRSQKKRQPLF